jgi:oligoendopeptidase F
MSTAGKLLVVTVALLGLCTGCCSLGQTRPPAAPPTKRAVRDASIARAQIPAQDRWNLSPLFADDAAFDLGLAEAGRQRRELEGCHGTLATPARLRACLDLYFASRLLTNRLTMYASLEQATDQESSAVQARVDRSQAAMQALMTLASLQRKEILGLDDAALAQAYQAEPRLADVRPYIDQMRRRRAHVLGDEAERVLSLAGDNQWAEIDLNELPSDHERAFQAFLSQMPLPTITDESGRSVQLTLSNYSTYRGSSDRGVRQRTVAALFSTLRQFDQTFAALLSGQARQTVFLARARGYDTALEAYLDRDEVAPSIYRNLVSTIERNLAPLHRYMRLRREQMHLDQLHIYDLSTPIVPTVEREIPFEAASQTVLSALAPLGDEYQAALRTGLRADSGWIDRYPHQGKDSGAFASSIYGTHPFVLLNYFGELDDALTLAHEMGHAMHAQFTMEHQPYVSFNAVSMISETTSTFNEVLVLRHLISQATSDDERLYLLGQLVESIRTTIYRQSLFASFELAVHTAVEQGTPTTAEFLDRLYASLLRKYYGDALTLDPNDGMEWAYVPHFYYKFYVYSYAVGLCSGIALGDRVLAGGPAERDAYLGLLSAGGSRPPLEILRAAGVDPSEPAVIEAAARLLDESLSQMEAILARRPAAPSR